MVFQSSCYKELTTCAFSAIGIEISLFRVISDESNVTWIIYCVVKLIGTSSVP
jgi:hypothetical protein